MVDKAQLNASWLAVLNDSGLTPMEKTAELEKMGTGIVKTFVEQEGFTGKIIPAEPILREQCIIDGLEGNLTVIRPIDDHRVRSVETNRTAMPTGRLVSGKDYRIWFTYRESEVIEKDLKTLQDTYNYDVQEIFENRIGLSLQKRTDTIFMKQVWGGLGYNVITGALNSGNGTGNVIDLRTFWGTGSGKSRGLSSEMFVQAVQKFGSKFVSAGNVAKPDTFVFGPNVEKPLIPFTVLMNIYDFQDLSEMPASEVGSLIRAEHFQQYNLPYIKNVQIVTTIHQELCPRGRMYFFARPDYIGHNFEIDPIQVLTRIDTFTSEFKMKGRTFAGQAIANANAFWELAFTPRGDVNPAANTDLTVPVLD